MERLYRFIGDPTGYRVGEEQPTEGWVDAYVGITDRPVRVNLDQAYMVEEWPWVEELSATGPASTGDGVGTGSSGGSVTD